MPGTIRDWCGLVGKRLHEVEVEVIFNLDTDYLNAYYEIQRSLQAAEEKDRNIG